MRAKTPKPSTTPLPALPLAGQERVFTAEGAPPPGRVGATPPDAVVTPPTPKKHGLG